MRNPICIFMVLLLLITFPHFGCSDSRPTDTPSEAPVCSLLSTEAPTHREEEPVGGYELTVFGDVLTVFLSVEQGNWKMEGSDTEILDVNAYGIFDRCALFEITPVERGN